MTSEQAAKILSTAADIAREMGNDNIQAEAAERGPTLSRCWRGCLLQIQMEIGQCRGCCGLNTAEASISSAPSARPSGGRAAMPFNSTESFELARWFEEAGHDEESFEQMDWILPKFLRAAKYLREQGKVLAAKERQS